MAKDKKSFLLYVDLIHTIEKLTDEQAGKLFKHVLRYVNDQHPESDQFTEVVFEPIKQTLKRDLEKYEGIRQRNSENAKKRWDATACDRIPKIPTLTKNADSDSVSVNDINNNIKERKQTFASSLVPFVELYGKEMIRQFYEYWTEHGPKDKKMRFEKQTSFNLELRLKRWNQKQVDASKPIYKQPAPIWE